MADSITSGRTKVQYPCVLPIEWAQWLSSENWTNSCCTRYMYFQSDVCPTLKIIFILSI